ncbi:U3 snoRNP protein [Bulinus truncatus]|nr:U3 snoRNP protein [Bulinus truncatus]
MGKSSRHKAQNVHHFVSFSERISNVNIDVIHRIRRIDSEVEGTLFGESLDKWTELDLTEHFSSFRREIVNQVQTYEQLVHHKDEIIESLKKHLQIPNSLALNALLDLLVQLAKDLQQDFVAHFYNFFEILVNLLSSHSQDIEALEQIFQTLAYLFRVLWRFLIKDFKEVFSHFSKLLLSSQKDYIQVFAAESCAYLLRKVKKQNELFNFLFSSLKESPELADGIGLLLFEMVKGVKNHFHTVSEKVLPLILSKLGPYSPVKKKQPKLPRELIEKSVTVFLKECAEHTTRENSKALWKLFLSTIIQVHSACLEKITAENTETTKLSSAFVKHLCRLLRVFSVWIEHNTGYIVADPEEIAKTLCIILKSPCNAELLGGDLLRTLVSLLQSCQERLPVDAISRIVSLVFQVPFLFSDVKQFVKSLLDVPFFEKDILPGCLNKINCELTTVEDNKKAELLAFVAEIVIHKTHSVVTGDDLTLLQSYPLDLQWPKLNKDFPLASYIEQTLTLCVESQTVLSHIEVSLLWAAVVCLPHLSYNGLSDKAVSLWKKLVTYLNSYQNDSNADLVLVVLNQLLKGFIISKQSDTLSSLPVTHEEVYSVLRFCPSSPSAVQITDLYLSWPVNSKLLNEETLHIMYTLLEPNLVSPSHHDIKRECVFKTMLVAEKLPLPTVQNYREKLIHLRKLECDVAKKCLPQGSFHTAPLLFLFGNEFWNFKLLWAPLADLITSYAHGLDAAEFWDIMLQQLKRAAEESEKELTISASVEMQESKVAVVKLFDCYRMQFLADERKPDFTNYRVQLWRAMKKFPEKCVLRSDQLCELYLQFLKHEFCNYDEDVRAHQSILAADGSKLDSSTLQPREENMELDVTEMEDVDKAEEDEEEEDEQDETQTLKLDKSSGIKRRKAAIQSLLVHLDLFATFKKQRSMFNQPEVQETFFDLLKHKHSSVQKAAFECVLTYKSPHVLPYRENFNRLLDDKTFKSEIVLFRIDEESCEVKEEDREGLLPVLMRILYGKMHAKTGNETAGKGRGNIRRSIVFGFLCGCKPVELKYFLELLFQPCMHFVTSNPVQMVTEVLNNVDLNKMIPLKKLKGILHTVCTVSQKIGHRIKDFTHPLLHILLGISATLNAALEQRPVIKPGAVKFLKNLRHIVLTRIIQFFENFEDLDFTVEEIDATFLSVVWPQSEKLVFEGVHHPTPLLKLFTCWSRSVRFFPLLAKSKDSSPSSTPLHSILALLNAPAINSNVSTAILELISNLLLDEDETEGEMKLSPLPSLYSYVPDTEENKFCETLLLPHVPSLLNYLQHSLKKMASGLLGRKQSALMELKILARISTFVRSPEESGILCNLLVPFLCRGSHLAQDVEENILISLTNLMQYVNKPDSFYRSISQLFSTVKRRESRVLLCKLFCVICENDKCFKETAALMGQLNAWDRKKVEEPDYIVRLQAFSQLNTKITGEETADADLLFPVIHNCCHFIYAVDDLSIRDNSTHCLVTIVTQLAEANTPEGKKIFNIIVEKTLVPQVKLGIRNKSETVRHEFLAVLQSLVKNCPNHTMFTGLKDLCDKDPEADFFENIRHIQIHKRSRALRRLFKHLKDHEFRPEIHMSYFNPLVYAFILDNTYSKHANIQDAAVDLLGAICKQLPWQYYLQLLRFYLKLLPHKVELQKQIVRIIVTLLDAFHFDLSNSTYSMKLAPKVLDKVYSSDEIDKQEINESNKPEAVEETESSAMDNDTNDVANSDDIVLPMEVDAKDVEEEKEESPVVKADGKIFCSALAATRIHKTIVISLLPQLHKIITQKAKSDDEHKSIRSKYPEDEEILRVPIALALIKLLQNLPKGTLENRLPGIILKICNFLRCRSRDVRTTARETLEKATLSLGARYFPFILKEMKAILTRGYQLHILSFTTHYLLKSLASIVNPGDLDPALSSIQDIFYAEMFGQVAEEKEVAAIKAKYFEAKFIKGYDAYELMAKCISASCLNSLVQPIKAILATTHSQRTANKAETLLRKVSDGLMANKSIPLQSMMVFIHSVTAKLITEAKAEAVPKDDVTKGDNSKTRMPDSCLILPPSLPRGGLKPKASKKTNIHILVEFGLHLLNGCLKKAVLIPTEVAHLQMLDPLIPAIRDCLSDTHAKTTASAMRCMSWLLKFPLPSLRSNIVQIAQGMFVVLQSYAGAATAKGGNQELVSMCFKAVTCLVRDADYYQVTTDQLQVLLTYCEEDLYNYSRQSTAFNLVRAILSRKLDVPQLHEVMKKLFEMSITAPAANIRLQARQVVLYYLMNYPHKKMLTKHILFYIDHLEYEVDEGRESALEMIMSMMATFPQKILNNNCPKFFHSLSLASFNDSSAKCRKLSMVALKSLLGKVDIKCRKTMFTEVVKWIEAPNLSVRSMAYQVCGLFVEVEGGKFESHLEEIMPLLQSHLDPSCYNQDSKEEKNSEVESQDVCLLAVLNMAMKIFRELGVVRHVKYTKHLNFLWSHVLSHLSYSHMQVRLASSQLLGILFSAWDPAEVVQLQSQSQEAEENVEQEVPFIQTDIPDKIRKLGIALCGQLKTPSFDETLGTQVIKNLLYVARLIEAFERPEDLVWLAKKVMREANLEVIHNVKITMKRNHTFKWVAAVAVTLKQENVQSILPVVLPALQREMTEQAKDQELKNLAQEVCDLLKKSTGVETFTTAYTNSLKHRIEKREDRKRIIAAEAVTNPDIAARKKIRHNIKKKEAKKRKIVEKRPIHRVKKNKLSILNIHVDSD